MTKNLFSFIFFVKSVSVSLSIFATFAIFNSVSHCNLVFRPQPYPLLRFTYKSPRLRLHRYSIVPSTTFVSYLNSKRLVKVSVCCDYPNGTHRTSAVVLQCSHIPIILSPSYIYCYSALHTSQTHASTSMLSMLQM
jgi:hypothetical protein